MYIHHLLGGQYIFAVKLKWIPWRRCELVSFISRELA